MTTEDFLKRLTQRYPVRNRRTEKSEFLSDAERIFRELGYPVSRQRRGKTENLVVGDLTTADVVVTAHYDTPKRNVFNVPMYYDTPRRHFWKYLWREMANCLCRFRANPNNVNDNSSGICGVFGVLSDCASRRVAAVLFDQEESGGFGADLYYRTRKDCRLKPHVNLDCIGIGVQFVVIYNRKCRELADAVAAHADGRFPVSVQRECAARYCSDNESLKNAVTLTAFKTDCRSRRYIDDIHTSADRFAFPEQLDYAVSLVSGFVKSVG